MQQRAYNYDYQDNKYADEIKFQKPVNVAVSTPVKLQIKPKTEKKKQTFSQKLISFMFFVLLATLILPYSYKNTTKAMFIAPLNTKHIKSDCNSLINKTSQVIANDWFLGQKFLSKAETKKPQMQSLYTASEIIPLSKKLNAIAAQYPQVNPTVFVWDFETSNWAAINPDKLYSAASIIKIPVLIELFKTIENGQLSLQDKMVLTDYYRAEGSGSLQYQRTGNQYTLDNLARVMIENSDNSATNMLMAKMGSMVNVNRAIRKWGLKNTYINNWLPDMKGTNYTTSRDLATMLYNIDNPNFLSLSSREKIFDYMSHVKNDRLLKAGLPSNAAIIHKTGDIGKTLGDAGIVYAPNGRKYIVVVMADRPYNSPVGKNYIVATSAAIYNYMVNGQQ